MQNMEMESVSDRITTDVYSDIEQLKFKLHVTSWHNVLPTTEFQKKKRKERKKERKL